MYFCSLGPQIHEKKSKKTIVHFNSNQIGQENYACIIWEKMYFYELHDSDSEVYKSYLVSSVHFNHLPEAFRKKLTMVTYVISVPDFKSAVPQDAQTPAPAAWPPPLDRWACLNSPPRPPSAATAAPPRGRRALRTLMHIKFGWYAIFKPHQIRNHKRLPHLSIYMRHRFSASHVTRVHFSFTVSIPNVLFSLSYFWLAL